MIQCLVACGGSDGTPAATAPVVVSTSGDISAGVRQFRALLGDPDNAGVPGQQPSGRRELNWDAVPDAQAAPNFLPPDFFNDTVAPRARGAVLNTPGTGVQVSADSDNPSGAAVRFGNINPAYTSTFKTYSAERLFSPIGSNIVNLTFFVAGTQTPAVVRGFGAVYTDVDGGSSSFEYFDRNDRSLGRFRVPPSNGGLSFLGVAFPTAVVARVHIIYGTSALGPNEGPGVDVAVMDDFLFGEPEPQ